MEMAASLVSKLEAAIAAHLRLVLPDAPPILRARSHAPAPVAPYLLITTIGADLPDDLPPSAGTLSLLLEVLLVAPADHGDASAALRSLGNRLLTELSDLASVQSTLNAPASGPDQRSWQPFHLSDFHAVGGSALQADADDHRLRLTFRAIATNAAA